MIHSVMREINSKAAKIAGKPHTFPIAGYTDLQKSYDLRQSFPYGNEAALTSTFGQLIWFLIKYTMDAEEIKIRRNVIS